MSTQAQFGAPKGVSGAQRIVLGLLSNPLGSTLPAPIILQKFMASLLEEKSQVSTALLRDFIGELEEGTFQQSGL